MIETTSNNVFTRTFFSVANDINKLHLEAGIDWEEITKEQKARAEKEHGNLYFQIRKAQADIDDAWKAKDPKRFKTALDKWRLLWQAEVDLWKRELILLKDQKEND